MVKYNLIFLLLTVSNIYSCKTRLNRRQTVPHSTYAEVSLKELKEKIPEKIFFPESPDDLPLTTETQLITLENGQNLLRFVQHESNFDYIKATTCQNATCKTYLIWDDLGVLDLPSGKNTLQISGCLSAGRTHSDAEECSSPSENLNLNIPSPPSRPLRHTLSQMREIDNQLLKNANNLYLEIARSEYKSAKCKEWNPVHYTSLLALRNIPTADIAIALKNGQIKQLSEGLQLTTDTPRDLDPSTVRTRGRSGDSLNKIQSTSSLDSARDTLDDHRKTMSSSIVTPAPLKRAFSAPGPLQRASSAPGPLQLDRHQPKKKKSINLPKVSKQTAGLGALFVGTAILTYSLIMPGLSANSTVLSECESTEKEELVTRIKDIESHSRFLRHKRHMLTKDLSSLCPTCNS